ncbi:type-IV secretion system protein TraC, partial [mine drainage metagenome]
VAQSGSGKSFIANELVCDFLSKNGIARVIDIGRSYYRFCEIMGGQNIVFERDRPMSINPFSGIASEEDLNELMPMLQDLVRLMAYPLTPEDQTPAFEYKLISKAIRESWLEKREVTELADVAHWLVQFDDGKNRGQDLALQLEQFTTGRISQVVQRSAHRLVRQPVRRGRARGAQGRSDSAGRRAAARDVSDYHGDVPVGPGDPEDAPHR